MCVCVCVPFPQSVVVCLGRDWGPRLEVTRPMEGVRVVRDLTALQQEQGQHSGAWRLQLYSTRLSPEDVKVLAQCVSRAVLLLHVDLGRCGLDGCEHNTHMDIRAHLDRRPGSSAWIHDARAHTTHTHAHTYLFKHSHTISHFTRTYLLAYTQVHSYCTYHLSYIHTYIRTNMHTDTLTGTQTYIHSRTESQRHGHKERNRVSVSVTGFWWTRRCSQ